MMRRLWKGGLLLLITVVMMMFCCACLRQEQAAKNVETQQSDVTETEKTVPPMPKPTTPTAIYVPSTENPMKQAYREDPTAFVVFRQAIEPKETYVPLEEVLAYESQYPECNGTWYRDQLEGEDLCIYNSYMYAMEYCFTGFELYVEDKDKDFTPVRYALSLDSPFLAQNTSKYERTSDWLNYLGERIYVGIDHFAPKRWEKKMDALEKCRRIVAGIPAECTTQLEKMEYLYRYVCEHVEYAEYEKMADEDYLYDAVITGETVCDGYSNMLMLLFRLIGVECCEVMGQDFEDFSQLSPEEQEEAAGHTWVVAQVDGEFYNFDPTFEDTKGSEWEIDTVFFCFSDELVEFKYMDLDEQRPKCTDPSLDFDYADLEVSGFTKSADVKKIAALTEERAKEGEMTTLVAIREPMTEDRYKKMSDKYWKYVEGIEWVDTSCAQIRNCTLLWMTVETA